MFDYELMFVQLDGVFIVGVIILVMQTITIDKLGRVFVLVVFILIFVKIIWGIQWDVDF